MAVSATSVQLSAPLSAQQPASSKEARQMSRETQQEIARTRTRIADNEEQVRRNLSELRELELSIETNRKTVADMAGQVKTLDGKIGVLGGNIARGEKELARMRSEYAKAVRKMRRARGRHSMLAFIFSAKDFNQALRRMRYLREFNRWRQRQTDKITHQIGVLKGEKVELGKTRKEKDRALAMSRRAQEDMQKQHRRQDEVVAELQRNGDALRAHLAEKQREADMLKSQISALIAQEQAKAAAERAAREKAEAERRAREKAAAERAAREKAEAERVAREKAAAERAAREKAEAERRAREQAEAERRAREARAEADRKAKEAKIAAERKSREAKEAAEREAREAERRAKEARAEADRRAKEARAEAERKRNEESASVAAGPDYAKARGRKPRENNNASKSAATSSASGFAAMKGALPKPVSGSFRIVSPFGKHALPDLPKVQYDNPGIDAEVSAGSHAQAVYEGKVSGVYSVPGYNTVVIINHGDYYTVYGNIASAAVKVGDGVKAGQNLGSLARDPDNDKRTTIHFEVWHNREKQNPAAWIR